MPSVTGLVHVSAGVLYLWTDRLVPETVRVHQGSETTVASALGLLRAEDEHVAGDAEAALGSLTWDQGSRRSPSTGCRRSCGMSCRASG